MSEGKLQEKEGNCVNTVTFSHVAEYSYCMNTVKALNEDVLLLRIGAVIIGAVGWGAWGVF